MELLGEPLLFFLGAALLGAAVRWWRPEVTWRVVGGYVAAVAAFFAVPLFTGALQVPTDIVYRWEPWREAVPERVHPRNELLSDAVLQDLPFHALVRRRLLAVEAPLWSSEMGTGQPLLGTAHSVPFAPLHLLALPLPTLRALTVSAAWQVLLGFLLVHALLLRLGAGTAGAVFAAFAAGLSTFAVSWMYNPMAMTMAWIPGLWLGLVLLRHGERRAFPGLVACALGIALGGHPETMAHAALAAVVVMAALLLDPAPGRRRFAVRLSSAALLVACLSAPVILPFLEVLPASQRLNEVRRSADLVQPPPFEARFLLPTVDPLAFGSPRHGDWDGPVNFNETCSQYAGLVALAAALAGAVVFRGRILAILAGGAAALLAALHVSPFFDMVRALPFIGSGANGRLRLLWVLAVAVAAGLSLDRLAAERRGRTAGGVLCIAAGGALVLFPPPFADPWERAWWVAALAGTAATLAALLVPALRRRFAVVAVAALLLDLSLLEFRYQTVVPARYDLSPPPALAFLIARSRASAEPFRVFAEGMDLHANLAALYGLWDARGFDPMQPDLADRFARRRLGSERSDLSATAKDYLGVRYELTRHRVELPPPWRLVLDDQGGRVWENPAALPLFFMPRRVERVPAKSAEAERVLSWKGVHDFRSVAVIVDRGPAETAQEGEVRSLRATANGFDLAVTSPTGGLVVSSVASVPGWRLEVDGKNVLPRLVNTAFLGFAVPPGAHAVRLRYRPAGWTWGLLLAGLGAGAAALRVWRAHHW